MVHKEKYYIRYVHLYVLVLEPLHHFCTFMCLPEETGIFLFFMRISEDAGNHTIHFTPLMLYSLYLMCISYHHLQLPLNAPSRQRSNSGIGNPRSQAQS
jgi:hypothetical protein